MSVVPCVHLVSWNPERTETTSGEPVCGDWDPLDQFGVLAFNVFPKVIYEAMRQKDDVRAINFMNYCGPLWNMASDAPKIKDPLEDAEFAYGVMTPESVVKLKRVYEQLDLEYGKAQFEIALRAEYPEHIKDADADGFCEYCRA